MTPDPSTYNDLLAIRDFLDNALSALDGWDSEHESSPHVIEQVTAMDDPSVVVAISGIGRVRLTVAWVSE
mgnify:CR=1 FL=1